MSLSDYLARRVTAVKVATPSTQANRSVLCLAKMYSRKSKEDMVLEQFHHDNHGSQIQWQLIYLSDCEVSRSSLDVSDDALINSKESFSGRLGRKKSTAGSTRFII